MSLVLHLTAFGAAFVGIRAARPSARPASFESRVEEPQALPEVEEPPPPPEDPPERVPVEADADEPPPLEELWSPDDESSPPEIAIATLHGRLPPNERFRRGPVPGEGAGGSSVGDAEPSPETATTVAAEPPQPRTSVRTPVRLISSPVPPYPEQARALGLYGAVRLRVEIREDGTVGEVEILESSGSALLDDAAVRGVRRWKFEPALVDGVPQRVRVRLPVIRFTLRG